MDYYHRVCAGTRNCPYCLLFNCHSSYLPFMSQDSAVCLSCVWVSQMDLSDSEQVALAGCGLWLNRKDTHEFGDDNEDFQFDIDQNDWLVLTEKKVNSLALHLIPCSRLSKWRLENSKSTLVSWRKKNWINTWHMVNSRATRDTRSSQFNLKGAWSILRAIASAQRFAQQKTKKSRRFIRLFCILTT